jgi:uroporphyrinogen decarboxylase
MFRKFFKPALKKLIDLGHEFGLKVMLHSCGSIKLLIPDLINIGLDILNPIQTKAKDMDPKKLKKAFGKDLSFHGSVDVQQVLPFGTVEEIKREVKQCIDALAPGGGFILAPAHNIQADTPIENIITLFETARKYGRY